MTSEARVTRLRVDVPADWRPPFGLTEQPGMRRVGKAEALSSARPHRVVACGGPQDGYEEWWVSDVPCGCPEHIDSAP